MGTKFCVGVTYNLRDGAFRALNHSEPECMKLDRKVFRDKPLYTVFTNSL